MSITSSIRNVLSRIFMSRILFNWTDPNILIKKRKEKEEVRKKEGRPHEVFYFHELSDPYSHITSQLIGKFSGNYDVDLVPLIVGNPPISTIHEPDLYRKYCLIDAIRIAPFYGIEFPNNDQPNNKLVLLAQRILCSLDKKEFISQVSDINTHLWSNNEEALRALINNKTHSHEEILSVISNNDKKRNEVQAYMGSTFSYEGELYWGVDRLDYLEDRLKDLGLKKNLETAYVSDRKIKKEVNIPKTSNLKLEFYPSLNSPYTAASFERIKELKEKYPIEIVTRPVLPMLMRNMTIPRFKAKYIISDSAREARKYGVPFGKIKSPLGKPAEKAYSLFPWVDEEKQGFEYIYRLMKSSFRKSEDIGKKTYLKKLIEDLGLNWAEAEKYLNSNDWKEILEKNRLIMYEGYSWGVPTFRIVDGEENFTTWGQDRIWLVEDEIIKRLNQ